jgi:hypothetical protein
MSSSEEEVPKCRMAKIIVESKDGVEEIPIAICKLGEKIDIRVPNERMLKKLFKEEKK